jgi:hypothetical protein
LKNASFALLDINLQQVNPRYPSRCHEAWNIDSIDRCVHIRSAHLNAPLLTRLARFLDERELSGLAPDCLLKYDSPSMVKPEIVAAELCVKRIRLHCNDTGTRKVPKEEKR